MDNKKLGIGLIIISVILAVILTYLILSINKAYQPQIDQYGGGSCPSDPDICPHVQRSRAYYPVYFGFGIVLIIISLGIYLIFFEKSQKAILDTLKETKETKLKEDKFGILLKGMGNDEKEIIKAIKEQDGISQSTLSLRTNIHKSKLSIILNGLEKKELVKKVRKGKINYIYLKIAL